MIESPNEYRREADLVEKVAQLISLYADKQALLEQAKSLRRRADEVEALLQSDLAGALPGQIKR